MSGKINTIETVNLIILGECNSKCQSCSYWIDGAGMMSLAQIKGYVPLLKKYNPKVIRITGGEPTLHPEFVNIIKLLKEETDAYIVLNTHGNTIVSIFPDIKNYIDAYIISLDSANRENYKRIRGVDWFNNIISVPSRIQEYSRRLFVAYSATISPFNCHELLDIALVAHRARADLISFNITSFVKGAYNNSGVRIEKQKVKFSFSAKDLLSLKKSIVSLIQKRADFPEGFILQTDATLYKYLELLDIWREGRHEEIPIKTCGVPYTSVVINQFGLIKPCFIHSEAYEIDGNDDLINNNLLVKFRTCFENDDEIKKRTCVNCYVYPYVLSDQDFK